MHIYIRISQLDQFLNYCIYIMYFTVVFMVRGCLSICQICSERRLYQYI